MAAKITSAMAYKASLSVLESNARLGEQIAVVLAKVGEAAATQVQDPASAFWVRPPGEFNLDEFNHEQGFITESRDPDELRRRALWSITWRGNRVYWTEAQVAAMWAEIERLKALSAAETGAYRGGFARFLSTDVACYLTAVGLAPLTGDGPFTRYGVVWIPDQDGRDTPWAATMAETIAQITGAQPGQGASGG